MAKKDPKYLSWWKYKVTIDGVEYGTMGFTPDDTSDSSDVTQNTDNGWSRTEAGTRTVRIPFKIPIGTADTDPPVDKDGIYPMSFEVNGNVQYSGDFRVTKCNPDMPIRGTPAWDIEVENYGSVTPP